MTDNAFKLVCQWRMNFFTKHKINDSRQTAVTAKSGLVNIDVFSRPTDDTLLPLLLA